jgi:AcrR family transcriptional regulator
MTISSARNTAGARRAQILRAAGELFRQNGYHATSMRQLAAQLNLQGASLYAHISGKEQLLQEIVDVAADAFAAAARSVPADGRHTQRLASFVRAHLRVIEQELETATVYFHEWTHLPPGARRQVIQRRDEYQATLRQIIAAGAASGQFRVPDVDVATLLTLSTLNWSYHWFDPAGRLSTQQIPAHFVQYILGALGAQEGE